MADIKAILKSGLGEDEKESTGTGTIKDLIAKVFCTRNLLHFAHWKTTSYAQHQAVGSLYDSIVGQVDKIVEAYQGRFGLLDGLTTPRATVPKDILKHVESESKWLCDNKCNIAQDNAAVENLLDELEGMYLSTIYKLKNLK